MLLFLSEYQIQIVAGLSLFNAVLFLLIRREFDLTKVLNLILYTAGVIGGIKIGWNAITDSRYHALGTSDWFIILIGGVAVVFVGCGSIGKLYQGLIVISPGTCHFEKVHGTPPD